jgi:hypothetical protein
MGEGRRISQRAPSLKLANGRVSGSSGGIGARGSSVGGCTQSQEEIRSPRSLAKDDSIKISIENTNTCTDSLVTALDEETLLLTDVFLSSDMNYRDTIGSGGPLSGSHHHVGKVSALLHSINLFTSTIFSRYFHFH